jgi:hypothetical protein
MTSLWRWVLRILGREKGLTDFECLSDRLSLWDQACEEFGYEPTNVEFHCWASARLDLRRTAHELDC